MLNILFILSTILLQAAELNQVRVGGESVATVDFLLAGGGSAVPTLTVLDENRLEITIPSMQLAGHFNGNYFQRAPHANIRSLELRNAEKGIVGELNLVGGNAGKRFKLDKGRISIESSNESRSFLKMAQDEQSPFIGESLKKGSGVAASGSKIWFLLGGVLFLALSGGILLYGWLTKKRKVSGGRKYLIEQLSYTPYGPKTGVSLVKIGGEFMLIGITPHQISLITNLNGLKAQYEEERQYEREAFQEVVRSEVRQTERRYNA